MRLALLLAVLALAGCAAPEDADPPAPTATARQPQGASVSIEGFAFLPQSTTIDAGASVTWTNNGPYEGSPVPTHTATAADESWSTGRIDHANARGWLFETPGEYPYKCNFHANMTGLVVVRAFP